LRILDDNDPVPRVPIEVYSHVGSPLRLYTGGMKIDIVDVKRHFLDHYQTNLASVFPIAVNLAKNKTN